LHKSYKIIKDICPDCKVILAGMAGYKNGKYFGYYKKIFDSLKKMPECKKHGCFDIFDIRTGGDKFDTYKEMEHIYSEIKNLLSSYGYVDKPIWSIEFGPLRPPGKCGKIKDIGDILIKLYTTALYAGFDKLFWRVSECPSWIFDYSKK